MAVIHKKGQLFRRLQLSRRLDGFRQIALVKIHGIQQPF